MAISHSLLQTCPVSNRTHLEELVSLTTVGMPELKYAVGLMVLELLLPVLIPCHRVIRQNGSLGGFSAGAGTALKAEMLELERVPIQGKWA